MQLDESQFEREGEEQVRLRLAREVTSAQGLYERERAAEWLKKKSRAREQDARFLSERQAQATEVANQLSKHQVNLTENAIRLAENADRHAIEANRLSKWAIGIGIVSLIVAVVVAVLK